MRMIQNGSHAVHEGCKKLKMPSVLFGNTKACKYARCSVATQIQISKETLGTDIQQATIYQVEEETRNKGNGEKKSGNLLGPVLQKGNGA